MNLPEGWTDDMSVQMFPGKSYEDLALRLMEEIRKRSDYQVLVNVSITEFGLSEADAQLAIDRVQGGIVRAISAIPDNEPNQVKDPLAWHSFKAVWKTLRKKHWWSDQREPAGEWLDWYNEMRSRHS